MVGDQQMSLPFPSAYSLFFPTPLCQSQFIEENIKDMGYSEVVRCKFTFSLLPTGKYIINILQNGNKPTICLKLNNVWVWVFTNFLKSFPAYHLQKNRFKIFDVSLIYSGSHFGANAYFKMTGLKDPVFLLSPLNFPKGIPALSHCFLLLQLLCRVTLGSPWLCLSMIFSDGKPKAHLYNICPKGLFPTLPRAKGWFSEFEEMQAILLKVSEVSWLLMKVVCSVT